VTGNVDRAPDPAKSADYDAGKAREINEALPKTALNSVSACHQQQKDQQGQEPRVNDSHFRI
jgi:hypothetical protein